MFYDKADSVVVKMSHDVDGVDLKLLVQKGVEIFPSSTPGVVDLVACQLDSGNDEVLFLYIDTFTHVARNRLRDFQLDLLVRDGVSYHVGRFAVDSNFCGGIGVISVDPRQIERVSNRDLWKRILKNVRPLSEGMEVCCGMNVVDLTDFPHCISGTCVDPSPVPLGKVISRSIESRYFNFTVEASVYIPAFGFDDILIVSDGDFFLENVSLIRPVEEAERRGSIRPTAIVFFSLRDPEDRFSLLGDIDNLASFIKGELLEEFSTLLDGRRPCDLIFAGASLGGYAAASLSLKYPEICCRSIVLSASFWYPDYSYEIFRYLTDRSGDFEGLSIYHAVGVGDFHLFDENLQFRKLLVSSGVKFSSSVFCGGHDYVSWRKEIVEGLCWHSSFGRL